VLILEVLFRYHTLYMKFTRESIFVSGLRAICTTFGGVLGICLALAVVIIGVSSLSGGIDTPSTSDLTVAPDANWKRKVLPDTTPVLLRIDVAGVIGQGSLKYEKFLNMLLDSREGTLANDRVKGILLQINSPGGYATTSSDIYHLIKEYKAKFKVPVIAYVNGLCASGGMYIACAADEIYATPTSTIGSVGVRLGPAFNVSDPMEKAGVKSVTLTAGKDKDMLNPFRPWKEGEDDSLKAIIASEYERFVDVVTTSRKNLSKEKLIDTYGAHVFDAEKAQELGYIDDGDASYTVAVTALAKASGIEGDYQMVHMEPHQSVLKELSENKFNLLRGKIEHTFPQAPSLSSEMSGKLLFLYEPY